METEICTRSLPARGRGPDRRFAFPRVETRCMAVGWGRMPDARSVVCALRQRIVVGEWVVLFGLAGGANAAGSNRSGVRSVGKAGGRPCRSRGAPNQEQTKRRDR